MELEALSDYLIQKGVLRNALSLVKKVGGGCINDCYCVLADDKYCFLKYNSASAFPRMFEKECHGLSLLRDSTDLGVPKILGCFQLKDDAYLLMEWVEAEAPTSDFWEQFGMGLAHLHQNSQPDFGLESDNYIGSLVQRNRLMSTWHEFFFENRVIPQLEIGKQHGWVDKVHYRQGERLAHVIEDEFPMEVPALLHGDLWSGNYMVQKNGKPVLVDPAVYYGHREMEMAFTVLFGGFHPLFYEAYQTVYPIAEDFKKRMRIHQLYPLMVHANLFGGHYVHEVRSILDQF